MHNNVSIIRMLQAVFDAYKNVDIILVTLC